MKNYWTPLAKLFGLSSQPSIADSNRTALNRDHPDSHWQAIRDALYAHALEELLPRWKHHVEVAPGEVFVVTELELQGVSAEGAMLLEQWHQETDCTRLIHWIRDQVWNTDETRSWIDANSLEKIRVTSMAPITSDVAADNPYLVEPPRPSGRNRFGIRVEVGGHWGVWQQVAIKEEEIASMFQLIVEDEEGSKSIPLLIGTTIVGHPKAPDTGGGQITEQTHVPWQDKSARYVSVSAGHVSAMHLEIGAASDQLRVRDLASTNGTYINESRLEANQWFPCTSSTSLSLGGPIREQAGAVARLHIKRLMTRSDEHRQITPLRLNATPLIEEALATIQVFLPSGQTIVSSVVTVPFLIGRSSAADLRVPAAFVMVSRDHFRIVEIDKLQGKFLAIDESGQGLTRCDSKPVDASEQGQWFNFGCSIELGHGETDKIFRFCIDSAAARSQHQS